MAEAGPQAATGRTGFSGAVERLVTFWAIAGGVVLLAVIAMNVISVVGTIFGHPFPGDFEMTEVGVAVAAFAFLPFCQISDANVTADIFTSRASPRVLAVLRFAASLVALLFGGLLVWRMYLGMLDQKAYGYTTAILQFPIWEAFLPILASLALLTLASAVTLVESLKRAVQHG